MTAATMRNPGTSAVLSFLIPGLGQVYNGDFLRGLFWVVITTGSWILTAGLFGWPFHLLSAFTAYRRAERKNQER